MKKRISKIITAVLIVVWVFSGWPQISLNGIQFPFAPETAFAADSVVTTSANQTDYGSPGAKQVWTSHTDGYVFYLGDENFSSGGVWMASTTDGGLTWSAGRQVDSTNTTDALDVAVWWDGWTDDNSGQYIHIATLDIGLDDVFYTRLDLATGELSSTAQASSQSSTVTISTSYVAITKAHDGVLYIAIIDNNDSFAVSCSTTCTTGGNWSERTGAFTAADLQGNSSPLLVPVGGTNNIMLIGYLNGDNELRYNVYSATSTSWWFAGTQNFYSNADGANTYEGDAVGVAYDHVRGGVYVSFTDDVDDFITADHDVLVFKYTVDGGWEQKTNPITDVALSAAKIGVNLENGYLYVAYVRRDTVGTATSGNVYYKVSYDDGVTWSAESEAINSTSDSIFMLSISPSSRYRFGATWKYTTTPNNDDIYFSPIQKWYKVKRTARLFEGFTLNLPSGRMIMHQE